MMLHISKVLEIAHDGRPHNFKFVAKGNQHKKRKGGYWVEMTNAVVTSSNFARRKMNLKSLDSGQTRWAYNVLLIEFDGHEIFL